MKYFGTKISDNMAETPEGYLLCIGLSIGRTGEMEYGKDETPIEPGPDGVVIISRDEDEVFRPKTIASFQGKPFTIQHPEDFVSPENWKILAKGVMQNVRRGEAEQKNDLVCDLLITDLDAISLVKNGMRALSCGYEAEYEQTGEGTGKQKNIIGNHLALVDEGRAGEGYEIKDHKRETPKVNKKFADKFKALFGMTIDEATVADVEEKPDESKPAVMDKGAYDELVKVCNALMSKLEDMKPAAKDADPEKEKEKSDDAPDLEARLAALEEKVSKLLEAASGDAEEEEKSEDEEEEKADDSDEEMEMVGDTASRAEILSPGIKPTKDVKVKALRAAYGTKDGKKVIEALTGGKPPSFDKPEQVDILFISASEILKAQRGEDLATTKRARTEDYHPTIFNSENHMTPEKMNEINAKRYTKEN